MSEEEAVEIVHKHARYNNQAPKGSLYSIRWPPTNPRALFSDDTRELVLKLLKRENKKK